MDLGISNILLAVGAGLASVLSPCVLPVVPVVVAGGAEKDDRLRPLLVVFGLSLTFMLMGAVSSLFGALLIGRTRYIELAGAAIIMIMGILVLFNINIFKRFYQLSNIRVKGEGRWSALVLGMALGLVWVPCIGPFLSSILTMVGTSGQLLKGVILLGFYSLGLAIPMLAVAYTSHLLQHALRKMARQEALIRYVTGGILIAFSCYQIFMGNFAFR
ncbi:MAG: cytochrome c biogenesis CcdA family protein [Nitrospiraceae bacterium]|nr:cytochrome c biogenesis CcdA family protein [Nitrospiraceae bacterium]